MTVLKDFQRLEAQGLWRRTDEDQRRDVIVSLGDATLVISDTRGVALAHWSLPAIHISRAAPDSDDDNSHVLRPSADAREQLEVSDPVLIDALERVHRAIERARPHPGRLRNVVWGGAVALLAGLAIFWLPDALVRHTASIVPMAKREEIGRALLQDIRRVAGPRCETPLGSAALGRLRARILPGRGEVIVLSGGVAVTEHLPGRLVLLNRAIVEDHEDPAVAAGYILAETQRAAQVDPLERLLESAGVIASFRLFTTGELPADTLSAYAETLLTTPQAPADTGALLARFADAGVSSAPYGYAVDVTGESTLALIEADPAPDAPAPISDGDWVSLQGICGE